MSGLAYGRCNRPVDPNKVVLMLAFNAPGTENAGAAAGACARGETLVIIPTISPELERARGDYERVSSRFRALNCRTIECLQTPEAVALSTEEQRLRDRVNELEPDANEELTRWTQAAKARGAKVSSLILSGHDGGGEFYGDNGETDLAEISELVNENREVFSDTSSLLLMGCWTSVPDQVDLWKTIFPRVRVLGGFVGSAPASTRAASGQFITGILRGEAALPENASRARVQAMINTVQNINQVTAGVYINPACEEEPSRSPAYYYVSPSQADNELPEHIRPGLSVYQGISAQEAMCHRTFGTEEITGTFDWNALHQYFSGKREPENNNELRSLYSFLRNNEFCFSEGFSTPVITAEQALFMRFFQDTKKNIGKYFKTDLETMYQKLDELVAASEDPAVRSYYESHKKLMGDSLNAMTRKETLEQISVLQGVYDRLASANRDAPGLNEIRNGMNKLDLHLYRLKCMHGTWHEYAEGETLSPPTCSE